MNTMKIYQLVTFSSSYAWELVPDGVAPSETNFVSEEFLLRSIGIRTNVYWVKEIPHERGVQRAHHFVSTRDGDTVESECWVYGNDTIAVYDGKKLFVMPIYELPEVIPTKWDLVEIGQRPPVP
jgi:hypothetical protein